jgi:hypothetical protein
MFTQAMKPLLRVMRQSLWFVLITSIAAMWVLPYGSFNPTSPGFYRSIIFAVMLELSFRFSLKGMLKRLYEKVKGKLEKGQDLYNLL